MTTLKSKYDQIIDRLRAEGKVNEMPENERQELIDAIEKDLEEYRFENQKRILDSQEEITTVVLTS